MEYKDMIFTKEIVELIESICDRCSFAIACDGNCSVRRQIKELFEKIETLEEKNKSLASSAKFWESEANYDKYEEYV